MFLWTPLCCFVATMYLFSQTLSIALRRVGSAAECHLELFERHCDSLY